MLHPKPEAPILILLSLVVLLLAPDEGHANPEVATSRWLDNVYWRRRPRVSGCWERPWVCLQGGFPTSPVGVGRRMCCRNRCVDVSGDENNCGFCAVRCPFSWRCCGGLCVDPSADPFHCGGCNSPCPFGSRCSYGMCGYAQPPPLPGFFFPLPWGHFRPRPPLHDYYPP